MPVYERDWVLKAVKLLIRNAGEVADAPKKQLSAITRNNLPFLGAAS